MKCPCSSWLKWFYKKGDAKALFALTALNFILLFYMLRGLNLSRGAFAFSDLPNFYNFGNINVIFLQWSTLYVISEWLLFHIIGYPLTQNVMFIASFVLPSYGIYVMLRFLTSRKALIIVVSLAFGTLLSPFLHGEFIGGGYEYGPWFFFTFLSLGFVFGAMHSKKRRISFAIVSGIFLGFANLTTQPMQTVGLLLDLPILVYIFILIFLSVRPLIGGALYTLLIFFASFVAIQATSILATITSFFSITGSAATASAARTYVLGSVTFTFRNITILRALSDSLTPFFGALILVILVLLFSLGKFKDKNDHTFLLAGLFYISVSIFIWVISSSIPNGSAYLIFLKIPELGKLDSPVFFFQLESVFLPVFLSGFIDLIPYFKKSSPGQLFQRKQTTLKTIRPQNLDMENERPTHIIRKSVISVASLTIVLLLILLIGQPVISHTLPSVEGNDYYAPNALLPLHRWYLQNDSQNNSGQILLLPFVNRAYSDMYGIIPSGKFFNIPYLGNVLTNQYNASLYEKVMNQMISNNMFLFSEALAFSDVQYIVVLKYMYPSLSSPESITPSFISGVNPEYLSLGQIYAEISHSSYFSISQNTSVFALYKNNNFVSNSSYPSNIVSMNYENMSSSSGTNLLNQTTILSNGAYLSSAVNISSYSNFTIATEPNLSFPNTLYWEGFNLSYIKGADKITDLYKFKLLISADLVIPNGTALSIFIYNYNESNPKNFYSDFSASPMGVYAPGRMQTSISVSVPHSTNLSRIIFQITPSPNLSATLYISNLTVNLETESNFQAINSSLLNEITNAGNVNSSEVYRNLYIPSDIVPTLENFTGYNISGLNFPVSHLFYSDSIISRNQSSVFLSIHILRSILENSNYSTKFIYIYGENLSLKHLPPGLSYSILSSRLIIISIKNVSMRNLYVVLSNVSEPIGTGLYMGDYHGEIKRITISLPMGHKHILIKNGTYTVINSVDTISPPDYTMLYLNLAVISMLAVVIILLIGRENRRWKSGGLKEK